MNFTIKDVPEGASIIAQAALDALLDGDTPFSLADGWSDAGFAEMASCKMLALARLLRSDEPLPEVIKHALADALDPTSDAPVRLIGRTGRRPSIMTVFKDIHLMPLLLETYDEKRVQGMKAGDALSGSAKTHGVNEDKARILLRSARANRAKSAEVGKMIAAGRSIAEIADFIKSPSRQSRGRPKKGQET